MTILFIALSIICSFISIEEYWNVVNIISALFLLAVSYTKIKKDTFLYSIPILIIVIKDMAWWIINVGVNFSRLAVLMSISGILKMAFDLAIIVISVLYAMTHNERCGPDRKKTLLIVQLLCMISRIILFLVPLIIYHGTYHNLYIELMSVGSYAFIFAGYLYCLKADWPK